MSEDSFTEVTSQSWFGRIGDSFKGIVVGLIMIVGSIFMLFSNEGCSVKRYKTLKEGAGAVISVSSDAVEAQNDSKLVHLTGGAETDDVLNDSLFGVSENGIKLKRVVEMYQWDESESSQKKKKLGGGEETTTTYSYSKTWSEKAIDSSSFKRPSDHGNPTMQYNTEIFSASNVTVGAFTLSAGLISKISNFEQLRVTKDTLPEAMQAQLKEYGGGYYIGSEPSAPAIGDYKISYKVVRPGAVSIVSQQSGSSFMPYHTKAGGDISLLQIGTHSAGSMFEQAQTENKIMTWVLRGVGFFLMFAGFGMVLRPLSVLADIVPLFGTIVGAGTSLIAFVLTLVISFITIAIAWLFYRPILSICLLVVAGVAVWFAYSKLRKAKIEKATDVEPASA
ncbi:TMEM43 family protein [Oligoflexia bacterium]|nr:TMEM43 family protein [Oligoflexia bacterium]